MADYITPLIGIIITLGALSFLFKENIVYRLVEHIYVGFAAGHSIISAIVSLRDNTFIPMVTKQLWINIIPILLGLVLFLRFFKQTRFASRWAIAFLLGSTVGLGMAGAPLTINRNLQYSILAFTNLDNIVLTIAVITAMIPFIFTEKIIKAGGAPLRYINTIGRIFIMVYLGGAFATTTMSRITVSAGRIQDVLNYLTALIPR